MKLLHYVGTALGWLWAPVRRNALFFVFIYALGVLCAWATLRTTPGSHVYENLYAELLLDVWVLCAVLSLLPHRARRWAVGVVATLLYVIAMIDIYCFENFNSTLTPTMLLLAQETDAREAGEFLGAFLTPSTLSGGVGQVVLLAIVHAALSLLWQVRRWREGWQGLTARWLPDRAGRWLRPVAGGGLLLLLVGAVGSSAHNKQATWRLLAGHNIGEVEHTLTEPDHAVLYAPVYRLLFSVRANALASRQVDQLVEAAGKTAVDSCSFRSPVMVLIIGESLGRHHSQQYGYPVPTTPRQLARGQRGELVAFSDVVSSWNLTSFVFKDLFSMYVVGDQGEWCDYALFPELFRKAGYHVTFLTNQFLPKAAEAVYDFSGGFFLNNPVLSAAMFDERNTRTHVFDEGLLADYDSLAAARPAHVPAATGMQATSPQLYIFHLLGQHVAYKQRSPRSRKVFRADDYRQLRPELTQKQRAMLAHYDNAVRYNDSIVDQICRRFEQQEAIVVYVPDHGEECYEEQRGFICRNHSSAIDWPLAHYEFEVPLWVWASPSYRAAHPDVWQRVKQAKDRRLMTDALPHMLLGLAGIQAKDYRARYDVLSPHYDEARPRLLKRTADYDRLRDAHRRQQQASPGPAAATEKQER